MRRKLSLLLMVAVWIVELIILAAFDQWVWFSFFSAVAVLVIAFELWAFTQRRKSISAMWGDFTESNPKTAHVCLVLMTAGIVCLDIHLW